jgi:hypothetical protein
LKMRERNTTVNGIVSVQVRLTLAGTRRCRHLHSRLTVTSFCEYTSAATTTHEFSALGCGLWLRYCC